MPTIRLPSAHLAGPRWIARLRVLDAIRHRGPIARIDISDRTGLSPATVTAITAELIEAGFIEPETAPPASPQDTKRGRPRARLQICATAATVAGLKVGTDAITVTLTDFQGETLGQSRHPLQHSPCAPEDLCREITKALHDTATAHQIAATDLAGAVVGLAGYIHGASGLVHWSSALTARGVPLAQMLEARAPCPIWIDNDVNLVAKAEHLFGLGRTLDSFLVVTVEHGIGLGIVIDGALHRGARGCGAEFGHTKVTHGGAQCQCGQSGCLEAYAGEYALVAQMQTKGTTPCPDFAAFCAAVRSGEPVAQQVLAEARQYFSMGLANLVNLFDPQEIIIASQTGDAHPLCSAAVLEATRAMVVEADGTMPRIRVHGWGDQMWAKGAAAQALEEVSTLRLKAL